MSLKLNGQTVYIYCWVPGFGEYLVGLFRKPHWSEPESIAEEMQ